MRSAPARPAPTPTSPDSAESIGSLIRGISEDFSTLARKEVQLAKAELSEILRSKIRAAALAGAGVVLGGLVLPLLLLFFIELLAVWLPRWAATLIVTLVAGVAAAVAFLMAKRFFDKKLVPEKTVQSLKEDVQWAKDLRKR
jgi:uncharacterized membrane protein YqjE